MEPWCTLSRPNRRNRSSKSEEGQFVCYNAHTVLRIGSGRWHNTCVGEPRVSRCFKKWSLSYVVEVGSTCRVKSLPSAVKASISDICKQKPSSVTVETLLRMNLLTVWLLNFKLSTAGYSLISSGSDQSNHTHHNYKEWKLQISSNSLYVHYNLQMTVDLQSQHSTLHVVHFIEKL